MDSKKSNDASLPALPPAVSFVKPANAIVDSIAPVSESKTETQRRLVSTNFTERVLRQFVYRCEVNEERVQAIYANATKSEIKISEIAAIVIRQLPEESPWDSRIMLDLFSAGAQAGCGKTIRVLSSTYVNYAFLPQGAAPSSQENLRRLAHYLAGKNPAIMIDAATRQFITTGKNPLRFTHPAQFAEYDSSYPA